MVCLAGVARYLPVIPRECQRIEGDDGSGRQEAPGRPFRRLDDFAARGRRLRVNRVVFDLFGRQCQDGSFNHKTFATEDAQRNPDSQEERSPHSVLLHSSSKQVVVSQFLERTNRRDTGLVLHGYRQSVRRISRNGRSGKRLRRRGRPDCGESTYCAWSRAAGTPGSRSISTLSNLTGIADGSLKLFA